MDLSGRGGLPLTDTDRAARPRGEPAPRRGLGGMTDLLFLMLGAAGLLAVMMPEEGRDRLMLPLGVMTLAMAALAVLSVRRARAAAAALDRSARLLRAATGELAASRQRFRHFPQAPSPRVRERAPAPPYHPRLER
ncbi:hypothetical protein GAY28_35690, partial [Azospirillum brasilense]|nr:hypothetical protein [Azospirillum brasilense]